MLDIFKRKWLYIIGYIYLLSSIYIFFLGNIKLFISIPVCIIITIAFFKTIKNMPDVQIEIFKEKKVIIGILIIILLWVILSGVGGFTWQNIWDHKFRNALFMDLVQENWPVIQDEVAVSYYMGFWLPAALIGKLFGLTAGYAFQVFWAFLGITIAFAIICQYLKKMKSSNIILMILFSGLDVIFFYLLTNHTFLEKFIKIITGEHLELLLNYFNSSSNTTLIFWLYNQIIPFWIGMMLILIQKNNKSVIYTYALLLLFAPFPMVTLAPVIFYMVFKNYGEDEIEDKETKLWKKWIMKIKQACTLQNLSSILIVIPIALFYMSNIATNKVGILEVNLDVIYRYILYLAFEFGIYLIFIYKNNKNDMILKILIVTTCIVPFIKLGNGYDFAARTSIPLAFYIMLLLMKQLPSGKLKNWKELVLVLVICLGAITPINEIIRSVQMNVWVSQGIVYPRSDSLPSLFLKKENECYDNFIANTDTIFYKYLSK